MVNGDMVNGKDQALPRMRPQATSMYSVGVAEPMDNLNQYRRKDGGGLALPIGAIKFNRDPESLPEKDSTVMRFGRELFGRQGMYELASVMGDYRGSASSAGAQAAAPLEVELVK